MPVPPEDTGAWIHQTVDRVAGLERLAREPAAEIPWTMAHMEDWDITYEDGERPDDGAVVSWSGAARGGNGGIVFADGSQFSFPLTFNLPGPATAEPECDPWPAMPFDVRVSSLIIGYTGGGGDDVDVTIDALGAEAGPWDGATEETFDPPVLVEAGTTIRPEITTPDPDAEGLVIVLWANRVPS